MMCVCAHVCTSYSLEDLKPEIRTLLIGTFLSQALGREVAQGLWQEPLICFFIPQAVVK